jgi:hypothetical protein
MLGAQVTGPDSSGEVQMTGHGVVVPGDTFTVWSDARSRQTRRVQVATTFQDEAVNLSATFRTLPSTLTYVAYAEVTVPAKQLSVQVQNSDFERAGQPAVAARPAAAAAPAVSAGQAATVRKMKELKALQAQGLITEAQYQAESQKLLNELLR